MSVFIAAIATDSGVPLFSRKRGSSEGMQFSTTASLHGINMFSKCHNVSILNTKVPNGSLLWKEFCKSITLIGVVTGGLECDLPLLLAAVHDVMVLCVGRKELESFKSTDQLKRELRSCYPLLDSLLESLDPSSVSGAQPTLLLDLMECILCPEAAQLQRTLETYKEQVGGRWACLSIHGRLAAVSSDWSELEPREARLLLLMTQQAGAPLRETPVCLPYTSPNVAFRAVICKLLADAYVLVMCGPTPSLVQIDETVLRCWEHAAQLIKEAKLSQPRMLPNSLHFESGVLGVLIVNVTSKKCVCSRSLHHSGQQKARALSGAHRLDILRTFYIRTARDLVPELAVNNDDACEWEKELSRGACETYWCSEYHKCHARRAGDLLCCALYASTVPTHTMRIITDKILSNMATNKEVFW